VQLAMISPLHDPAHAALLNCTKLIGLGKLAELVGGGLLHDAVAAARISSGWLTAVQGVVERFLVNPSIGTSIGTSLFAVRLGSQHGLDW